MFYISTYLPRINKTAKLREFTNRHHFNLSKFYFNNDVAGIVDFFNNALSELIINEEIYCELTCIEKFIIWLNLYYNCLYDSISIYSPSLNDHISIKIPDIIKKINSFDIAEEKEITVNGISITLNAPFSLYIDNTDDIFNNVLYSIKSDDTIYYYQNFTSEEKSLFLASLPGELFDTILEYYKELNILPVDILPQGEAITFDPALVTAANGAMFAFLKSIFAIEIKSHYSNCLAFTKHFGGDIDSYYSITLRDFLAIYQIYESSQKSQNTS